MASGTPDYWGIEDQYSPATDDFGRFIMIVRDPTSDNYAAVDTDGNLLSIMKGFDGALYRAMKVDEEGRIVGVMKGQADVTWELHGWWKFIASEGIVVKDYSGYGNNLDAHSGGNGAANYIDGIIGQGLHFNGVDTYVGLSDDPSLSFAGGMSMECWMQPQGEASAHIMRMNGDATTYGYYIFQWEGSKIGAILFDHATLNQTTCLTPDSLALDQWYHVVVTTDRTHVKVYVDGVLKNTVDDLTSDPLGKIDFNIGSYNGISSFFKGDLDEARVYNRCLSQDEVNWRYANTNPATGKPTRMVAVDTEGRMRVNVEGFPFKSRLMDGVSEEILADGHATVLGDTVPMGKIWVIEKFFMWCSLCAVDEIRAFICTTAGDWLVDYKVDVGVLNFVPLSGPFILGGGDYFKVIFYNGTVRGTVSISWNGYELDTY